VAIYHLNVQIITRSKGHSAVAGAAYRSRSSLRDERTGETHNYSRKADELLFEGIYAPKDAPGWASDRAQLWNHVEAFEKRRDAQLAREFVIALPQELTLEQNSYALQDWVRENFTRKGLIADVVIHAPGDDGDQRNTHGHVMVVMRKLDGATFAAKKERTADKAERQGELETLRASWERLGNRHLERHGFAPTLDRRTLLAQGIDRVPTFHLGKDATALERKGVATELGDYNRTIAASVARETTAAPAPQPAPQRVRVATTGGGMVAQQREAMRRYAKQAAPPAPGPAQQADRQSKEAEQTAAAKQRESEIQAQQGGSSASKPKAAVRAAGEQTDAKQAARSVQEARARKMLSSMARSGKDLTRDRDDDRGRERDR
jgi:ATP-dependent exoDNAse (exonuclease V) alpha subunit